MKVLFAISIVCLGALFWAAFSMARHIVATKRRRRRTQRSQAPFTEVLFEEKQQQIRDHSAIASAQTLTQTAPAPRAQQSVAQGSYARSILHTENPEKPASPVNSISSTNGHRSAATIQTAVVQPINVPQRIAEAPAAKKAPQPVFFSREHKRLDWDYFNKDLGDLSDPYQPSSASDSRNGTRRY